MQYSNVVEPATCVSIRFGFRIAAPVVFLGRALVRAPVSQHCGPGSIPSGSRPCSEGFSPGLLVFLPQLKPIFLIPIPARNSGQEDPLVDCPPLNPIYLSDQP